MKKYTLLLVTTIFLISGSAYSRTIYFLGHPESNESGILKEKAKKIILKKIGRWNDGSRIKIFLPNGEVFPNILKNFLNMSSIDWETYWGKMSLQSGETPPEILRSELLIIRNVSKNKKAIGIITDNKFNKDLRGSVKVLLKVEL